MIEGNRRRTQVFEGIVLKRQGSGARETFTVRKQSFGVGVERTFPLHSPKIEKLEIAARGDVRRAKLYYLRGRIGKAARVAERRWGIDEELISAPVAADGEEPEAVDAEGVAQSEAEVEVDVPPRPRSGEEAEAAGEEPAAETAESSRRGGRQPRRLRRRSRGAAADARPSRGRPRTAREQPAEEAERRLRRGPGLNPRSRSRRAAPAG